MACEAEHRPLGVFECQLCALTAPYSYVGQKPPDTQSVILLEESYVMKDPFTPDKDRFLILGSRCSVCGRLVCVGPVGMQSVLLQEVLPPLCPEEPPGLPPGDPAGPGKKERPHEEAGRPAQLAGLSRRPGPGRVLSWELPGSYRVALFWNRAEEAPGNPAPTPELAPCWARAGAKGRPGSQGAGAPPSAGPPGCVLLHMAGLEGPASFPRGVRSRGCPTRHAALLGPEHSRAGKGRCRGAVPVCGPLAPQWAGGACAPSLWFQPQAPGSLPSRPRLGAFCCLPAPLPSELSLGPAEANPTASALRVGARLLSAGSWRQALPCVILQLLRGHLPRPE